MYNYGLMMFVILNLCFTFQIITFKFFWEFPNNSKFPTLLLTILFLVCIMFNPLNILKRAARIEICYTLGNILAAPFFVVKFRHFFLADVITSARLMLSDGTAMMCFYTSGEFTSPLPLTCMWATNLNYLWGMIPFWWRMW